MKHKVEIVKVHEDVITLRVDGALCSYFIQRPQPLGPADAALLRNVLDTRVLESLISLSSPQSGILSWFCGLWKRREKTPMFGEIVADYIEKVGAEIDIDEKTKALVIHRSHVDKIRREDI